jgi:hypothetical protein
MLYCGTCFDLVFPNLLGKCPKGDGGLLGLMRYPCLQKRGTDGPSLLSLLHLNLDGCPRNID